MPTASYCGLICCPPSKPKERIPIPLKSVNVHAEVRGWTVAVTAELAYQNSMDETVECQFVFPLSDKSAVYRLEADIAGKKLLAECKPRKEAEESYMDAVDSGRSAVLMENQSGSPDVFRIMLGNLVAKEEAKVTVGFVQPAERDENGELTVMLPAVLNPRYVPEHQLGDAEKMKEQFHSRVPYVAVSEVAYSMAFTAKISLGAYAAIEEVSATNAADKLKTTFEDGKLVASVSLDGSFVQDHDFGIRIVPAAPFKPMVFVEPGLAVSSAEKKNWLSYDVAAAWFEPETAKDKALGTGEEGDEYWLVIDRSGSMGGDKIKNAQAALVLFVKSLPVGCKFNIVGFGSRYAALFQNGTVEYNDENVNEALSYANKLKADFGGTEIMQPLRFIYDRPNPLRQPLRFISESLKPKTENARRFIVLLTDGEVGNTDEVIRLAKDNAATSRVFTVGIGEGASTALVNGLARVSGGVAEFVKSSNDRLQAKVVSLLKASTNPAADNIKVDWNVSGGKVVSLLPDALPTAAYQGRPIMQYALIERNHGNNVDGHAKLTASIAGTPVEHKLNISIPSSVNSASNDAMPLHRLAAKAQIQDLADKRWSKGYDKDKLVSISVATGILCEETAFVAVDPETRNELKDSNGRPTFIDVERPTVYGGGPMAFAKMSFCAAPMMSMAAPRMMKLKSSGAKRRGGPLRGGAAAEMIVQDCAMIAPGGAPRLETVAADCMDLADNGGSDSRGSSSESPSPPPSPPLGDKMDSLVRLQGINGSWLLSDDFVKVIASSTKVNDQITLLSESEAVFAGKQISSPSKDVVATLIALAVLRRQCASRRDEWELIANKAVSFLSKNLDAGLDIDDIIESLANALSI